MYFHISTSCKRHMMRIKEDLIRAGTKAVTLCVIASLFMGSVFLLAACGKSTETSLRPTESTTTARITESTVTIDGQYDLDTLFGTEPVHDEVNPETVFIGINQIETDYTILDPGNGITLTQEEIDRIDQLFEAMEEVTGLSFLNGKYGSGDKVTIHIQKGIYTLSSYYNTKSIIIDINCVRENMTATIHELVHILQFCNINSGSYPFLMEGHAEFWTQKISQYILDQKIEGLYEWIDLESYLAKYQEFEYIRSLDDLSAIYDQDMDYWMDRGCIIDFSYSWPSYVYGRLFFLYLEDVYGNVNAFLPINARIPFKVTLSDFEEDAPRRKYIDIEPYKKLMMFVYGDDVFDNFYPWLREHEELFEQYYVS